MNTVLKLPCGEDQKKLAIQFLDTGALWFQHGISHAVESTLKAMHEKASQEPTAPAAPTQEAGQELQQADDAA